MDTKVITTHLPLPLAERIDQMAAQLQRSRGWIMKQALQEWVDRADPSNGKGLGFAEAQAKFEHDAKSDAARALAARAVEALKSLRETTTLGDISWQELRDTGRK
jgi:predicted transcriptional regulator